MKRFFNFTTDREVEELRQAGKWVLIKYSQKEVVQTCAGLLVLYIVLDSIMWIVFILEREKGSWDFLAPLFTTIFAVGFLIAFSVFCFKMVAGCIIADEDGITRRPLLGEQQYLSWKECCFIGRMTTKTGYGRCIVCSIIPLPPWDSSYAFGEYLSIETSKHIHCRRNIYVPGCDKADVEVLISLWGGRESAKEQGCGEERR